MRWGLIGGSGSTSLRPAGARPLAGTDATTPWGDPSGPLWAWTSDGGEFLLQFRHGDPHRWLPHEVNYRANLWQLRRAGADLLVGVNTVGGIAADLAVGQLVVPHQLIDYTAGRPASFGAGPGIAGPHVDFTAPFAANLRQRLARAAAAAGCGAVSAGIYGVTQGPRLETAAEIDRLARDGCTVVGMTAMPEAILARELGLPYALICVVVNPAAGRGAPGGLEVAGMAAAAAAAMVDIARIIAALPSTE